jgi:hypothetical protein
MHASEQRTQLGSTVTPVMVDDAETRSEIATG